MAWAVAAVPGVSPQSPESPEPLAILCLEDGRAVRAGISEFTFDYRYSNDDQKWYDVSRITEETDADTNQEDADDGRAPVQGLVPDPD